jgi:hypothetical protein
MDVFEWRKCVCKLYIFWSGSSQTGVGATACFAEISAFSVKILLESVTQVLT